MEFPILSHVLLRRGDVPFSSQLGKIIEIIQDFPCIMLITPLININSVR